MKKLTVLAILTLSVSAPAMAETWDCKTESDYSIASIDINEQGDVEQLRFLKPQTTVTMLRVLSAGHNVALHSAEVSSDGTVKSYGQLGGLLIFTTAPYRSDSLPYSFEAELLLESLKGPNPEIISDYLTYKIKCEVTGKTQEKL